MSISMFYAFLLAFDSLRQISADNNNNNNNNNNDDDNNNNNGLKNGTKTKNYKEL